MTAFNEAQWAAQQAELEAEQDRLSKQFAEKANLAVGAPATRPHYSVTIIDSNGRRRLSTTANGLEQAIRACYWTIRNRNCTAQIVHKEGYELAIELRGPDGTSLESTIVVWRIR